MVYLFLGTGFEEVEAVATIDVLRRAEVELTTVSVMNERSVEGAHGVRIEADKMFDEVDCTNAEMLILPGGMPGTLNLGAHEGLVAAIREQNKKGRWIAAICAAHQYLVKCIFCVICKQFVILVLRTNWKRRLCRKSA